MRLLAVILRRRVPGAAAYVSGSFATGDTVYGLSDLDLEIVVPDDPAGPGFNRERVLARWRRLSRAIPWLATMCQSGVHEDAGLLAAASGTALTIGLDEPHGLEPAIYHGRSKVLPTGSHGLLHGPGLYGPTRTWRHLGGPDRLPVVHDLDAQDRRISSWLSLQSWWRWLFRACLVKAPWTPYLCVKLVSEPIRILLWLDRSERLVGRTEVLRRGLEVMPQYERPILRALELRRSLPRSPAPPLEEMVPWFAELSCQVARAIGSGAAPAGTTAVRLDWDGEQELLLPPSSKSPRSRTLPSGSWLPLADWRALCMPSSPDEAFMVREAEPTNPAEIAAAARAEDGCRYEALRTSELLVMPTSDLWTRGLMRTVQCATTDPVSFGLLAGSRTARFPNLKGWSAEHLARRSLAEHRAWLQEIGWTDEARPAGKTMARAFCAVRAALFAESLDDGDPELSLTVSATARALAERHPGAAVVAEEAHECYRRYRVDGREPPEAVTEALNGAARSLPGCGPAERAPTVRAL